MAATDRRFLIADERGSITAITDSMATVKARIRYDAYGLASVNGDSAYASRFRYTGQTWLSEIGMYYYKARLYHPVIGRFMQTDPIGYADGMNWYAYVGNDPVNNTDPTGTFCSSLSGFCNISLFALSSEQESHEVIVKGQRSTLEGPAMDDFIWRAQNAESRSTIDPWNYTTPQSFSNIEKFLNMEPKKCENNKQRSIAEGEWITFYGGRDLTVNASSPGAMHRYGQGVTLNITVRGMVQRADGTHHVEAGCCRPLWDYTLTRNVFGGNSRSATYSGKGSPTGYYEWTLHRNYYPRGEAGMPVDVVVSYSECPTEK